MDKGRVLVTGAGGFVMSSVVAALLEAEFHVTAVDHAFASDLLTAWDNKPVEIIQTDVEYLPDLRTDFLVHGAVITSNPDERGETAEAHVRANLLPLLAVSEWAARQNVKRWIFISSAAVLAHHSSGTLDETAVPHADHPYAAAKLAGEALVSALRHESGRDVAAVRLADIYGINERPRPSRPRISAVGQMIHDALTIARVRIPDAVHDLPRDWTLAQDVGRALTALLAAPKLNHDLYHITSGETLTLRTVADMLKTWQPELVVETDSDLRRAPRGTHIGRYLQADTGFDSWTPFATGLRTILLNQRAYFGVSI